MTSGDVLSTELAEERSKKGNPPAVIAGFSGWLLDAFDFFLVTFCLTAIAKDFHKSDAQIALVITMTLAFRPVGGFIFGLFADHYGRRLPLMINIGVFAVAEILTGLAPNYKVLRLAVRALFGIVMGGNWGVGASSLAMEGSAARQARGPFGPASGRLCRRERARSTLLFIPFRTRRMAPEGSSFWGACRQSACCFSSGFRVKESDVWQKSLRARVGWSVRSREILSHWKLFLYLLLFMTMMLFASHGTQDMYPTFLQRQWHFFARPAICNHRIFRNWRHLGRHHLRALFRLSGGGAGPSSSPLCSPL